MNLVLQIFTNLTKFYTFFVTSFFFEYSHTHRTNIHFKCAYTHTLLLFSSLSNNKCASYGSRAYMYSQIVIYFDSRYYKHMPPFINFFIICKYKHHKNIEYIKQMNGQKLHQFFFVFLFPLFVKLAL